MFEVANRVRRRTGRLVAMGVGTLAGAACGGDSTGPGSAPQPPPPPAKGSIQVTAATTGNNPDPDGYAVRLNGVQERSISVDGTVTYPDLETGSHTVELSQLAANCSVPGGSSRTVDVTGNATAQVQFDVSCPGGSISGTINVIQAELSVAGVPFDRPVLGRGETLSKAGPLAAARRPNRSRDAPYEPEYAPDRLIVEFDDVALGAPPSGSRALFSAATARPVAGAARSVLAAHAPRLEFEVTGVLPATLTAGIRVRRPERLEAVAEVLRSDPAIRSVRRSGVLRLAASARGAMTWPPTAPNDPLYPFQAWHYTLMDLPRAWEQSTGSSSVVVAIVDSGIVPHPDLVPHLTGDGYDFVSPYMESVCPGGAPTIDVTGDGDGWDPDPEQTAEYVKDANDCFTLNSAGSHGSHVAGTVGALGDEGFGTTGVAWSAALRPV